jgi:hypothetical protein
MGMAAAPMDLLAFFVTTPRFAWLPRTLEAGVLLLQVRVAGDQTNAARKAITAGIMATKITQGN